MAGIEIPFNRPFVTGREGEYLRQVFDSGRQSGDGVFTARCQALLERAVGARKALLATSCTDALEMCAMLLGVGPGDEVVVPSFTFVSSANAFVKFGATPVFADIRPDTLNLDEASLPRHLTERTRAVVAVHYAGVGCEMDALLDAAAAAGAAVVEDNAHGLLGKYKGRALGSLGCLATQSFHETKNFSCGEGGALLINDDTYLERAEIIREKGTNRTSFFRGDVDKYSWVDLGSSYLPADLLAAVLYAQLEARQEIQGRRRRIWETYQAGLADWARTNGVGLPVVPSHCEQPYHMFFLLMPTADRRDALISRLRQSGILAVFHYLPLHLSPMGRRFGGQPGACPVAEDLSQRLVRLPFYAGLSAGDQTRVVDAVREFTL